MATWIAWTMVFSVATNCWCDVLVELRHHLATGGHPKLGLPTDRDDMPFQAGQRVDLRVQRVDQVMAGLRVDCQPTALGLREHGLATVGHRLGTPGQVGGYLAGYGRRLGRWRARLVGELVDLVDVTLIWLGHVRAPADIS